MSELNDELERFARNGNFNTHWEAAMRTSTPKAPLIALALAAAAVLALASYAAVGPWFSSDAPAETSTAAAPEKAADADVVIGRGSAYIYTPKAPIKAASIVDPSLLHIQSGMANSLLLQGRHPGRTDVVLSFEGDHPTTILTVVVDESSISPQAKRSWKVPMGGYRKTGSSWSQLSIVDLSLLEAITVSGQVVLVGRHPGSTDIMVVEDGKQQIHHVDISEEATAPGAGVQPKRLAMGQALLVEAPAAPVAVSIADPSLLDVQQVPGRPTELTFQGRHPGLTDVLITHERGLEHHRVIVTE